MWDNMHIGMLRNCEVADETKTLIITAFTEMIMMNLMHVYATGTKLIITCQPRDHRIQIEYLIFWQ